MSTWTNILDLVYPVGSFYQSYKSTSPATLFGGTWTAVTGRFLYANASVATGGANTVTLTVDQMPNHTHTTNGRMNWFDTPGRGMSFTSWDESCYIRIDYQNIKTNSAGKSQPHDNMPAYQSCYTWHRTA